jgi:2'-5' RNA ligase
VKPVRLFVAIELEPLTASLLSDIAQCVCQAAPSWAGEKWVRPANLHVTVKFLGDLPEASLALIGADVAAAALTMNAFDLPAKGLSAQPSANRCSLAWVEFATGHGAYAALSSVINDIAADYGVPRERREPCAHVTIVRARRPKPLPRQALDVGSLLLERLAPVVSVVRATIFNSTLTPSGPIYRPVVTAPLRCGQPG